MRSTRLFELAKAFRADCKAKETELKDRERELEDLKGSPKYREVKAQIDSERESTISNARNRYAPETDILLKKCLEAAQKCKPMEAPTEEALRTLQLLEMRFNQYEAAKSAGNNSVKAPTSQELNAAVPLMKGNATAIETLRNIATRCGVMLLTPVPKGMTENQAQEAVKCMARSLNTLYHLPKVGDRENYGMMMNGYAEDQTHGHAAKAWMIDVDYKDENDFLSTMSFVGTENIEQFKEIINQE